MICRPVRRASAILALTAACLILPLSDASAAPRNRSESRWNSVERSVRVVQLSFRNALKSFWAQLYRDAGMDIDGTG